MTDTWLVYLIPLLVHHTALLVLVFSHSKLSNTFSYWYKKN